MTVKVGPAGGEAGKPCYFKTQLIPQDPFFFTHWGPCYVRKDWKRCLSDSFFGLFQIEKVATLAVSIGYLHCDTCLTYVWIETGLFSTGSYGVAALSGRVELECRAGFGPRWLRRRRLLWSIQCDAGGRETGSQQPTRLSTEWQNETNPDATRPSKRPETIPHSSKRTQLVDLLMKLFVFTGSVSSYSCDSHTTIDNDLIHLRQTDNEIVVFKLPGKLHVKSIQLLLFSLSKKHQNKSVIQYYFKFSTNNTIIQKKLREKFICIRFISP